MFEELLLPLVGRLEVLLGREVIQLLQTLHVERVDVFVLLNKLAQMGREDVNVRRHVLALIDAQEELAPALRLLANLLMAHHVTLDVRYDLVKELPDLQSKEMTNQ